MFSENVNYLCEEILGDINDRIRSEADLPLDSSDIAIFISLARLSAALFSVFEKTSKNNIDFEKFMREYQAMIKNFVPLDKRRNS